MLNNDWITAETTIQVLLDASATIANITYQAKFKPDVLTQLQAVHSMLLKQVEKLRDPNPPPCYGEDDCSTAILSTCPWRDTCGNVHE